MDKMVVNTFVLCEPYFWMFIVKVSFCYSVVSQALRDQKRVVTAYWLNDVLVKKKMFPPCQVLHLPIIYGDKKPCNNQVNYFIPNISIQPTNHIWLDILLFFFSR